MIHIFSHDRILSDNIIQALPSRGGEAFFEEARLAGAISKELPDGLIFDLRSEPKPLKLLERCYYEHPSITVIIIRLPGAPEGDPLGDRALSWPVEPPELIEAFKDIKSDRDVISACSLVGRSNQLASAARIVLQVAQSDINVLITGPSGAGKEMIARALHAKSAKPQSPYIAINVAALAPGIIESELFGHEKGSFTGAAARRLGVFEQAFGGTIFLDEIGEIPPEFQAKLLRVLEQRTFTRVGGNIPIKANFRLIAATNRDLPGDIAIGRFREDLYYRLKGITIDLPPLVLRKPDIAPLTFYFLGLRSQELRADRLAIESGALRLFHRYDWPGNVRELKNVIDSFSITSHSGRIIASDFEKYMIDNSSKSHYLPVITNRSTDSAEHHLIFQALMTLTGEVGNLKRLIEREMDRMRNVDVSTDNGKAHFDSVNIEDAERELIARALDEAHGNRKKAAKLLGMGERTLYRKLDKYGFK